MKCKYSYAHVLNSYTVEKQNSDKESHIILYYIYRKISFVFSWILVNTGIRAYQITILTYAITISMIIVLLQEQLFYKYIGFALMYFFYIFDCVDGNVARITETSSKKGEFFDFLSGVLFSTLTYPLIAFSSKNFLCYFDYSLTIYGGFFISIIVLLIRLLSLRASTINPQHGISKSNKPFLIRFMKSFLDLTPILYIVSTIISTIDIFILVFLCYSFFSLLYTLMGIFTRLIEIDNKYNI